MARTNTIEHTARLMAMLAYLKREGEATTAELAARFEVSETQITKDVELLWVIGLPGDSPLDYFDFDATAFEEQRIVRLQESLGFPEAFRLTDREAIALAVCLKALQAATIFDHHDVDSRDVFAQVFAHLRLEDLNIDTLVDVDWSTTIDTHIALTLREAMTQRHQVEIGYVDAGDNHTVRVIEPIELRHIDGYTYLFAWCTTADAIRSYRLDRIQRITPLDVSANHTSDNSSQLPDQLLTQTQSTTTAILRLKNSARVIAETVPYRNLVNHDDNTFSIELAIANQFWLMRLILEHSDEIISVSPGDFAMAAADAARRALQNYVETP